MMTPELHMLFPHLKQTAIRYYEAARRLCKAL